MNRYETMPVGIIVQKRRIAHPWREWAWEAVGVLPWAPEGVEWRVLLEEPDRTQYHAGTLPLELHRGDLEAYVANLESAAPAIYVVLRKEEDGATGHEVTPHQVTVSPYEAQHYLHSGEEIVERLLLPEVLLTWVKDFIDAHHVPEPFVKRQRVKTSAERPEEVPGDPRVLRSDDVYRAPTGGGRGRVS